MREWDQIQTLAAAYADICRGRDPWVALGNFMNEWFDYARDQREQLVADPLILPESPHPDLFRWAVFCAASVEWLCERAGIPCPSWALDPVYTLPDPWFDTPYANKPHVRTHLIETTPEPFKKRNIYCGNRMFANKYELAEQFRRRTA
ncbi:MAG: hypothetical protein M3Y81_10725 [Chloroflexota bacterium]|nr:hypothetical protein [Chloroflexota bacterium]